MGFQEGQMWPCFAANPDVCEAAATINITAAGAVLSVVGSPGIGCVRTGAGAYNLTFPPSVDAYIQYSIQKSTTVFGIRGIARVAGSGTASFQTYIANGTLTDPASGDEISVYIYARTSGA
jgi:hypothetical protein